MPKTINKGALLLLTFLLVAGVTVCIIVVKQTATTGTDGLHEGRNFVLSPTPTNIDFGEMDLHVYIHSIHYDMVVRAVATNTSDYYFVLYNFFTKKYKLIGREWFEMIFSLYGDEDQYGRRPQPISILRPHGSAEMLFSPSPRSIYDYIGAGTFLFVYELVPDEVRRGLPCRGVESSWVYLIVVVEPDSLNIWQNTNRLYYADN